MRALVTGGTGFLGKHVVRKLLSDGHQVRCLVRPSSNTSSLYSTIPRKSQGELELVEAELGNLDDCLRACAGCDVVYHIAAEVQGSTAVLFMTNVVTTRVLAKASVQRQVSRFVLVSSIAVHGTASLPNGAVIDERCALDSSPHLRDPYTFSKAVQEEVCWELNRAQGFPLVVVRPGVLFGSGRDCLTGRVGIKLGKLMLVMSNSNPLPFTHVENCASAVMLAGVADNCIGESFNIVDDNMPTAQQLIRAYKKLVGGIWSFRIPSLGVNLVSRLNSWYHKWSKGQLPAVLTPYKSRSMWGPFRYSNEKAKKFLHWQPEIPVDKAFEGTFEWLRTRRRETAPPLPTT